jgi:hypothetical protein
MYEFAEWTIEIMGVMLRLLAVGTFLLIAVIVVCTIQELKKRGRKHDE